MRLKKSLINSSVGMITYILAFLPMFIVRKVFIEILGSELLGLSSLYTNIVGYLSIVEMGIGSAIIYSLYKPYAEGDISKVKSYLKYYEKFYKKAGFFVLFIGIAITPFLNFFIKDNIDFKIVQGGFILFLINTFIGYLFTYKHCILNVAQEGYKVSLWLALAKFLTAILQVITIYVSKNFYAYIIVQILINFIFYYIINKYINQKFIWIKGEYCNLSDKEEKSLIKNIKALFFHKVGEILVFGTDNIVISSFISLSTVASYNNYTTIINAFSGIIRQAMSALTASIGNLLIEKDKEYAFIIHKRLFFISFWVVSFITISLNNTISQFISLWVGKKYELDMLTISLILFNLYFYLMRGPVSEFKSASGEYYKDRYAPIIEGIINLITSILFVTLIGLPGVFLGTLISNLAVVFWIQPKIVYKYVFKKPIRNYFSMYFKYLLIGIIPLLISWLLTKSLRDIITLKAFFGNCLINIFVINSFYILVFRKNKNFIYFKEIVLGMIKRLKKFLN